MAEFEEGFKGKEDVNSVSAKRKYFLDVSRKGDKWQARIRHPKLKVEVHLGYYSSREEAALVVKNKKAEFEEMLKGVDGLREKRRRHEFEGMKLPCCVRRDRGKFRVRIWQPELKRDVSFGAYSTWEEAAVVVDRKRAELRELYGGKLTGSSECEHDDKVLQETESDEADVVPDSEWEVYGAKLRGSGECEDDDGVVQETEEETTVVADRKTETAELWEMFGEKPRSISECEDDDKVLQEAESEEAAVVADRKREVYEVKMRGSGECEDDDEVLQETEGEEAAELWEMFGEKPRSISECEDDDEVLHETESEETAVVVKNKNAEFEEKFKGTEDVNIVESETCDGVSAKRKQFLGVSKKGNKRQASIRVEKRRRHEFEGRQLPKGVTRECGKFRVRLWHPVLNKYASFGYYSSYDEAVVVTGRKKAELQEVYEGNLRGSSECEDDDKVLQETENKEAAVVADLKRAELREVYEGKVRGSGVCEDDDEEVLQESMSEVAGKFECADEQAGDLKVPARIKDPVSNDRIWLGTCNSLAEANKCFSKEKTVLDTEMIRAEFEEQFKGKEDVNIVEDETCDGVLAKTKHFLGVSKKGNKWQARVRHPELKTLVYLGYYSTPEEAALVVKNKKAEFEETLKGVDGLWKKRRGRPRREVVGRKLSRGVRRDRGKFRVRIWHPELKKDISFGAYSTYEEADVVADRKRAELRESYGGKPGGSNECEDNDKVLQECETSKGGGSH